MTRYTYPHTIDNGHGERITFLARVPGRDGDRLEVENVVAPGAGPPMHVHHLQAESLTVVEGRIGWTRPGEGEHFAGPGETVTFLAGDPHRFWNAGDGPLRCRGWIEPAHNIEYFLGAIYDMSRRTGGKLDPWDLAFLLTRYRSEFAMLEMPSWVAATVLPAMAAVGRLLGRYARFADAPEPVRR